MQKTSIQIPVDKYEYECSLINSKYQLESKDNHSFQFIKNNAIRIIQLSTIAKLTTDNHSLIHDFSIDFNIHGIEPYFNYTIKVADTSGIELYIFVHYKGVKTYLFPVVMGFKNSPMCSPVKMTDNWRTRGLLKERLIQYENSIDEFGINGMMMVINNSGIYGENFLLKNPQHNLFRLWKEQEDTSLHDKHTLTIFSSSALILQIWLHTIGMWKKRCLNRKVKVVYSSEKKEETADINSYFSNSKNTIVNINKDIIIYVNNHLSKREFKGFYIKQSERCGHFRHLPNGNIIYITPTTVHYKKLVPDELLVGRKCKPLIYRNSEDFLREKSYLEYDVHLMLKENSINYVSEKTFPWLGKKRLDFYLPDKNIAIECQGVQHFYPYGAKDKDLKKRQQRDTDKYNECIKNGVKLLYFVNPEIPIPEELAKKYNYISSLDKLLKEIN